MTLDEINALDREAFTIRLGHVAEGSPWVAYGAWDYRPFRDPLEMVAAFRGAIARADDERQIALIEEHAAPMDGADDPDLAMATALDEVVKIIRLKIADLLAI
jgi:2-oxo-4-hydroxy-4-carboxy--5-ureidoimidazoline (OHCU) decarboxylase